MLFPDNFIFLFWEVTWEFGLKRKTNKHNFPGDSNIQPCMRILSEFCLTVFWSAPWIHSKCYLCDCHPEGPAPTFWISSPDFFWPFPTHCIWMKLVLGLLTFICTINTMFISRMCVLTWNNLRIRPVSKFLGHLLIYSFKMYINILNI